MKKTLCILLALLLVFSLFACSGSKSSNDETIPYNLENNMSMSEDRRVLADLKENASGDSTLITDSSARKIIYTASVYIESTEYDKATAELKTLVESYGGYISDSDSYGRADYGASGNAVIVDRSGWFKANIPSEKLDDFLSHSGDIGNVTGQSKSSSEITDQYTDNEARLTSLRTEQTRLLELLSSADSVDTLLKIEERLGELRGQIESIESTLNFWDKQLAYSAVTVNISEVELYSNVVGSGRSFPQKVADAFVGGFSSFGRFLSNLAVGIVYILPYVIVAAVIIVIVTVTVKKHKKKTATENKQS